MTQTSYTMNIGDPLLGMPDGLCAVEARTYFNPDSAIEFGFGVVKKAGVERGAKLPSADTDDFLGVAHLKAGSVETNYPVDSAMSVVHEGEMWVAIDQDVSADDPVFVRFDGTAADIGKFRKDADTDKAMEVTSARWLVGGLAVNGRAKLYLNGK